MCFKPIKSTSLKIQDKAKIKIFNTKFNKTTILLIWISISNNYTFYRRLKKTAVTNNLIQNTIKTCSFHKQIAMSSSPNKAEDEIK